MIARRSAGLMRDQCAISSIVRAQPRHNPAFGSSVQTLIQGVSIVGGMKTRAEGKAGEERDGQN
jgi:hypothetical protein